MQDGRMTRRDLMMSLGALASAPVLKLTAQPAAAPIPVSTISHVAPASLTAQSPITHFSVGVEKPEAWRRRVQRRRP